MNLNESSPLFSQLPKTFFQALNFEKTVRCAESEKIAEYLIVNDLRRLFPYQFSALWREGDSRGGRISALSGVEIVDQSSKEVARLTELSRHCIASNATVSALKENSFPTIQDGMSTLWCPLHAQSKLIGGLILLRSEPWRKEEIEFLSLISGSIAHSLWAWRKNISIKKIISTRYNASSVRTKRIAGLVLLALVFFPIRQSVLAPAEIIPKDPSVISAPMDGIVSEIYVQPNSTVQKGSPLFSLDDTGLKARKAVAEKTMAIASADLQRVTAKAFSDDASKGEIVILQARVDEKAAELAYINEQIKRSVVTAPQSGVAVYGDPNDWLGKPLATGERLMLIADPQKIEIKAYLSVNDAITLEPGSRISLFMNATPLFSVDGVVTSASYEAYPSNLGGLSYIVKASVDKNKNIPRIGLQGTAKIYGKYVALSYYLLRKPFSFLRRLTGF